MICAPCVGLSHHWKNVLFGCAFLLDETIASFVWASQSFLEVIGNKAPKTIFTDQYYAMANAIRSVLSNTSHRLCCESELEMENTWKAMCHEWKLKNNKWLENIYRLYIFSVGIRSTQRSKSTNSVFQDIACKTMTLSQFIYHYEKQAEKMCNSEVINDFEYARGMPWIMVESSGILKHVAYVYTRVIYRKFQDEFLHSLSEHVFRSEIDGPLYTYILEAENSEIKYIIHFCPGDSTITCSCKHTLCILTHVVNFTSIPSQYILKRWTKTAKRSNHCNDVGESSCDAGKSKTLRLKRLIANHDVTRKIATTTLMDLHSYIMNKMQYITNKYDVNYLLENDESKYAANCGIQILDPLQRRPKYIQNTRLKSISEKRKRNESSCIRGISK
ncbi:hypothetical protein ACJRO7_009588 [Eucalyptus globulus]|uniref:MULE transposase domain-containing protein n=1 Tax=Eucalyptus globulus TaxID=34317 RepID=A0ABD3LCS4_EUCGL